MKFNIRLFKSSLIMVLICLLNQDSYAGFSSNSTSITVTGNETGNSLRAWIGTSTNRARVTERDIVFKRHLIISSGATFSDENAVYQFTSNYYFAPKANSTITLTDFTIHYTGSAKGHSYNNAYTANFTRVFYLQGVTSSRSDFFNNGDYTFNMSDVTMVSYGPSDYLHFQTSETLHNITIINASGGLNFEPGARNNGQTEIIHNLKLQGVSQIVGGSGALGDFKVYNLDWDAPNWQFGQRSVDFLFVNPIKPNNWNAYTGTFSRVKEFYTHDIKLVDQNGNGLNNIRVALFNNQDLASLPAYTSEFDLTSNSNGEIPQQEVLKIDNSLSTNLRNRSDFTLAVIDYNLEFTSQIKSLNSPTNDIIPVNPDQNISETNPNTVGGYSGININHNNKEITISSTHTLCEVYDYLKHDKIFTNLHQPSLSTFLVNIEGETLNINDYKLILQSGSELKSCDKFLKLKSTKVSNIGSVSDLKIALEDANGTYKLIKLSNITNADVLIRDENNNDTLLFQSNYNGEIEFTTQSSSNSVLILVSKANFSNWLTELDLSQTTSVYNFKVSQVEGVTLVGLATEELQEEEIYLLQKILQNSASILTAKSNNPITPISITTLSPSSTAYPTSENQEESLELLKRILSKITRIQEQQN